MKKEVTIRKIYITVISFLFAVAIMGFSGVKVNAKGIQRHLVTKEDI